MFVNRFVLLLALAGLAPAQEPGTFELLGTYRGLGALAALDRAARLRKSHRRGRR